MIIDIDEHFWTDTDKVIQFGVPSTLNTGVTNYFKITNLIFKKAFFSLYALVNEQSFYFLSVC